MAARRLAAGGRYIHRAGQADYRCLLGFCTSSQSRIQERESLEEEKGREERHFQFQELAGRMSGDGDRAGGSLKQGSPAGTRWDCSFLKRSFCTQLQQLPPPKQHLSMDFMSVHKTWDPPATLPFEIEEASSHTNSSYPKDLLNMLEEDQKIAKEQLDIEALKKSYYKSVRPALMVRCLLSPYQLDHAKTHTLYGEYKRILGSFPKLMTSYYLMLLLYNMNEENWCYFLDFLCDEHVIIIEDWTTPMRTSSGPTYCDNGLKCPPDESVFYKGECDASVRDGKATISIMIRKGKRVIICKVLHDMPCKSSVQAEAIGMYYLLKFGFELKIDYFQVSTDCAVIASVMRGAQIYSETDKNAELYNLLKFMGQYFKKLVPRWEPREKLAFVDILTKSAITRNHSQVSSGSKTWTHFLNGYPVFNFVQSQSEVTTILSKNGVVGDRKMGITDDIKSLLDIEELCYLEVTQEDKLKALWQITKALSPSNVFIGFKDIESMSNMEQNIATLFGDSVVDFIKRGDSKNCILSFSMRSKFHLTSTKHLILLFDSTIPIETYSTENALTVLLATPDESDRLSKLGIPVLSTFSFSSFHQYTHENTTGD